MNHGGRYPLLRPLALGLAALHFAVYAAAPAVDAHGGRSVAPAAVERSHSQDCGPVHRPDLCALCRLASARLGPAPTTHLEVAARLTREAAVTPRRLALPGPRAAHPDSRAPPLLA